MPNQLGKWKAQVKKHQAQKLSVYEPILGRWAGFLGDNTGVVQNPNYPSGYVFVRDRDGHLVTAWNQRVPNIADLPVIYGYDPEQPKLLQVLSQWQSYSQEAFLNIPNHGKTHQWPGTDTVFVQSPQIMPALVTVKSGMIVAIFPFALKLAAGTWKFIAYQELDLTSHIPATSALWALIEFSVTDGSVQVLDGSAVDTIELLNTTDVQAPDSGYMGLAAVACYAGQTEIIQNDKQNQIMDLRGFAGNSIDGSLFVHKAGSEIITGQKEFDLALILKPSFVVVTGSTLVTPSPPIIRTDTSGGSFSLTLRAAPSLGEMYWVEDYAGSWDTHPLTLLGGVYPIGSSSSIVFSKKYGAFGVFFDGTKWILLFANTGVAALDPNKVVLTDAGGNIYDVAWVKVNASQKQLILGDDDIPLGGGVALHIIDEVGRTGGEAFLWAFGVGTTGGWPAGRFTGRLFAFRGRGTVGAPTGILAGDEILNILGHGYGSNGNFNTDSETNSIPPETTFRVAIIYRATNDFTETDRSAQVEIWAVPPGTIDKQLIETFYGNKIRAEMPHVQRNRIDQDLTVASDENGLWMAPLYLDAELHVDGAVKIT